MNQGSIAGAGIAEHLHQHIVPRWALDSNFFPIIAGTKAVPQLLGDVRDEIAAGVAGWLTARYPALRASAGTPEAIE